MSAHDSIHQYYIHQQQLVERCYEGCLNCADPELVHQMRLGIKKLRAFGVLAGYLQPDGFAVDKHLKHDLKRLFKIAGQLRDIQVQIHLLAEFEGQAGTDYPEFGTWLRKREKKRIQAFIDKQPHLPGSPVGDPSHQDTGKILGEATDEAILDGAGKALEDLFAMAKKLSAGAITDEKLHALRTLTKQLRYIYSMTLHSYPGFVFGKISIGALREIETAAGNWHDCLVRVELFNKFSAKRHLSDDEISAKYEALPGTFKSELKTAYKQACKLAKREFRRKATRVN